MAHLRRVGSVWTVWPAEAGALHCYEESYAFGWLGVTAMRSFAVEPMQYEICLRRVWRAPHFS